VARANLRERCSEFSFTSRNNETSRRVFLCLKNIVIEMIMSRSASSAVVRIFPPHLKPCKDGYCICLCQITISYPAALIRPLYPCHYACHHFVKIMRRYRAALYVWIHGLTTSEYKRTELWHDEEAMDGTRARGSVIISVAQKTLPS
jgi:hypothetical protein